MPLRLMVYLGIIAGLFLAGIQTVAAQSSSFTYQGQLQDGGSPATGSYDLQFRLFDALVSGSQVGSTQVKEDVAVASGIFTIALDFGAAAFPGANRYLEISVRPGVSVGAFTTLVPLQQIATTPYALQSLNATTAQNALQLGGTAAGQYVLTGDARLSDSRAPTANSPNYIQNTSSPQASSNFNISGNGTVGGNLTVTGTLNGSGANLTSLNATNITTGTLSTSRLAVPFVLSGAETLGGGIIQVANFAEDGVGLYGRAYGTSGRIFGVWGVSHTTGGVGVQGTSNEGKGVGGNSTNGWGVYGTTQNGTAGVAGATYSTAGAGVRGDAWSNTGTTYGVYGSSISSGGIGVYGTGNSIGVQGESSGGYAAYFEGKGYFSGNLGIGTTTPDIKLSVSGVSSTVNIETSEMVRLTRPAVGGVKNTNSAGFLLGSFETGILGRARLDIALSGTPVDGNVYGTIPDVKVMSLLANGNVGIGVTNPGYTLQVNGSVAGVGAYNNISDGRFKQDIQLLTNALSMVLHMRGVSYAWRQAEFPQWNFSAGRQVGFIAQELAPVLPEAVSTAPDGVQSIAYTTVVPVLVEAIKEQQQQYAAEKADIEHQLLQLQEENAAFKQRLAKLEQNQRN